MSANKLSGINTLQYKAIRKNYYHIVLSFEQVLTKLTALCFEKELISTNERDDPRQPLYDRSEALLMRILRKVELHQKWYYVFLTVLDEYPELSDIKLSIESSYASEDGSQFASLPRIASLPRRRSSRLEDSEISHRHSESDLAHSKNIHPTDLDSGVLVVADYSEFKNGDAIENVPEEEVSVDDEQPRLLSNSELNEDGVSATSNSVAVSSEGVHSLAGTPIMFNATKISELECKERDAQIELQEVKVELMTALLEKEMALSQLREKYYIEEKAKTELEILLEKEKAQRAQEATEH